MRRLVIRFASICFSTVATTSAIAQDNRGAQTIAPRSANTAFNYLTPRNPAIIDPDDLRAWRTAEVADSETGYTAYLTAFPSGWFQTFAKVRIQAGIPVSLKTPPTPQRSARANARDKEAWHTALWLSAQSVGTANAYRDYLLFAPLGAHRREAAQAYMAASPTYPSQRAPDCLATDTRLNLTRSREGYRGDYPDAALQKEKEDISIGELLVDHRGATLAWMNAFHVDAASFAANTERTALARRHVPLRAGCIDFPTIRSVWAYFLIPADNTPDQRPTPTSIDAAPTLNTQMILNLPADRALVLTLPHDGRRGIYGVEASAAFPVIVQTARDNETWRALANNKHVSANGPRPVRLRISAPDQTVQTNPKKPQAPPHQGAISIVITRLYSAPLSRAPTDVASGFEVTPTPPASPATPPPTR
jgi:hypothetical protein